MKVNLVSKHICAIFFIHFNSFKKYGNSDSRFGPKWLNMQYFTRGTTIQFSFPAPPPRVSHPNLLSLVLKKKKKIRQQLLEIEWVSIQGHSKEKKKRKEHDTQVLTS